MNNSAKHLLWGALALWASAPVAIAAPVPWESAGLDWSAPPTASDDQRFAPPATKEFSLDNGLRVLVVERHGLPLVSMQLVCLDAGATSGLPGLAYLTGELLTQGAGVYTPETFAERLESLGAMFEVLVGRDATTIDMRTLSSTLDPTLDLLANMLTKPLLRAEDFARKKSSILEQIGRREDEPRGLAAFLWYRLAFGAKHPYGAAVEGQTETVRSISLQHVLDYVGAHYNPRRAVLIVVGDVTAAQLKPMLQQRLANWQSRPVTPTPAPAPAPADLQAADASVIYLFHKPAAPQSVVYMGTARAPYATEDYQRIELVNTALGGSFASRLNSRLREELGFTYGVGSRIIRLSTATGFIISSSLKSANTVDGIREMLAILERTRTEPLSDLELQKTKRLMMRSFPQDFETNKGVADILRGFVLQGRPLAALETAQADIAAVAADAAQRAVAAPWQHPVIVVVGDKATMGALPSLGLRIVEVTAAGEVRAP